ncbi:unnamed protein product [Linum trigynum]|uniref:Bifunctional inhibitor/plant lipid transfer protein/seed storage helical domain-containing protein n=1 Tax=Linum trigynum TaxID=586398 RepID=A0AAV2FEG0_9ROSI
MAATRNAAALSMAILLLTVQLLWAGGSMAQSSDCTPLLLGLQPCLPYITGNTSTPAKTCCTQLANVVKVSPTCLCQLLDGSFGVSGINRTRALELPAACNVQTPPASTCNSASPSASPGGIPLPATPSSPAEGSAGVPGTGSSDGSSIKVSASLLLFSFFFIAAASCCSSGSMRY